ncbi:MAG: response regulator [Candidatus Pelagadaptatus aseana]|uniref:response regulator n=1 Tax=Candidatus Pelagadaptatus aseana TaxID=3120508 RepID=UPI0039B13600
MNQKHLLVVDDHQDIRDLLKEYLQQHGYRVSLAKDGVEMRAKMAEASFDLVVLDLMMPGEDGLSLCRFVREMDGPPVIMLTAMSEDADLVVGLEMGADDYVTKPFTPRVLLARIKAVLRRSAGGGSHEPVAVEPNRLSFANWSLNVPLRQLERDDGLVVALSNSEFTLLQVLLKHPQEVMSRDQLLTLTKGREAEPFDRSVDNQVSRLRKKIEQNPQFPNLIKTVWGGGYLFTATVSSTRVDL